MSRVRSLLLLAAVAVGCGSSSNGSEALDGGSGGGAEPDGAGRPDKDASLHSGGGGADARGGEDAGSRSDAGAPALEGGGATATVGYVPGGQRGPGTTVNGCEIFPTDNAWNVQVDGPDVRVTTAYSLPASTHPHPDLGGFSADGGVYGIPFNVVPATQPDVKTTFGCFADQSDPGPEGWSTPPAMGDICPAYGGGVSGVTTYPFFTGMKIEGDLPPNAGSVGGLPGDAHALVLQAGAANAGCTLWEAWSCENRAAPFTCANGAVWDLSSNALRPKGWTSADLAGLSVFAGLVRIADIKAASITHAIRVTFQATQAGYILPATHATSGGSGPAALGGTNPPMGLRLRMSAHVDTSSWSGPGKTVAAAMKKYGLLVADIGSDWYFQGDSDDAWNENDPHGNDTYVGELITDFHKVTGADFEVVVTAPVSNTGL